MLDVVLFFVFVAIIAAVLATCGYTYVRVGTGNQKSVRESVTAYGVMVFLLITAYGILSHQDGVGQPWTTAGLVALFVLLSISVASSSLGLIRSERRMAVA